MTRPARASSPARPVAACCSCASASLASRLLHVTTAASFTGPTKLRGAANQSGFGGSTDYFGGVNAAHISDCSPCGHGSREAIAAQQLPERDCAGAARLSAVSTQGKFRPLEDAEADSHR